MLTETITILLVEDNSGDACLVRELLQEVEAFQFQLIHVSRLADALTHLTAKTSIALSKRDEVQHNTIAQGLQQQVPSGCDSDHVQNAASVSGSKVALPEKLAALSLRTPYLSPQASPQWTSSSETKRSPSRNSSCVANRRLSQGKKGPVLNSPPASRESSSLCVILLNISLPDAQGVDTVKRVHLAAPNIPIVAMSDLSDEAIALQTLHNGAQDYLVKSHLNGHLLVRSIRYAIVRQRTEEVLRESETKYRTLYESTSAPVILLDENKIFDANSAALQLFGCTQHEQLCGKHPREFSPLVQPNGQDSLSLTHEYMATAISEGSCRFDWVYRKRNGEDFSAEVMLSLIELENCKVLQAVIYDIAKRKQTETQLLDAKEAAEAGSRAKSEFLATMSHELRTPLNAILGLSQLLRQEILGTLNDKQKEYITCIHSSGEHLLALINDILDLSKVEAGKEQLNFLPLNIQELCEDCLTMVREQAHDQGLKLILHIDSQAEICIGDQRRCKQMLLNLLSNAVKFTLAGEVSLIVRKLPKGISFTVADTGIGIASENLPLLFEPFRQLDSGLNRRFPGTGLGLALTQSLAWLHGGDVTVESTLGQGSKFTLYLPDSPTEKLLLPSSPEALRNTDAECCPNRARSRILLVEDDERSALLLKDYLQVIGHKVEHLTNGTGFLNTVRSFKPDLILIDVQLPGDCTGFDLLAALRRESDTKRLTVVMVAAKAMTGDSQSDNYFCGERANASRERCLEAGADDYLSQPIGIAQLEAILMRFL
jgi:PAS domain S-box-containing protein